jgi:microcystin-dependent protein
MEPFIGEIIMFGGNFAPRGWALCDGQLLSISSNSALFSILGTTYGGDGRTTFGLPDLRGRVPMHAGNGPGLEPRNLGQKGGAQSNALDINNMPGHNHNVMVTNAEANQASPVGHALASPTEDVLAYSDAAASATGNAVSNTGGGQPFTNEQPYQCVNFIIALVGVFPSRN